MDIFVTAGPSLARGILKLNDLTAPCALGNGGVATAKNEGDGITPAGEWPVRRIWYRPDREPRPVASPPVALSRIGGLAACDYASRPCASADVPPQTVTT